MSIELTYLVWVSTLTAFLWIPYLVDRILVWGLVDSVGYPEQAKTQSPWAQRLILAHVNAVENLVIFATLVIAVHVSGISNNATLLACSVYFWARVVHVIAFTFKVSWVRTLAFVTGFGSQVTLAWQFLF